MVVSKFIHTRLSFPKNRGPRHTRPGPLSFGVISVNQKEFYKTQAWKRARRAFIDYREAIDGGLCEVCGEEPGKIVHHTIWLDDNNCNDPDVSLNPSNFKYECQTCHNKEVDPRKATPGRVLYGPHGEIIRNTSY